MKKDTYQNCTLSLKLTLMNKISDSDLWPLHVHVNIPRERSELSSPLFPVSFISLFKSLLRDFHLFSPFPSWISSRSFLFSMTIGQKFHTIPFLWKVSQLRAIFAPFLKPHGVVLRKVYFEHTRLYHIPESVHLIIAETKGMKKYTYQNSTLSLKLTLMNKTSDFCLSQERTWRDQAA